MSATDTQQLDVLLEFLNRARGFDLTGYKRASLDRRIRKRMEEVGVAGYTEYIDHLETHADEFEHLFNTILINVTAFFRDPAAWEHLRESVIPELIGGKAAGSPVRVWSAGCASGEEAYTIAMVLADALGEDDYLERVKIYATDADEEALTTGRHAVYPPKLLEPVPVELRDRFFERIDRRWAFRKDLRRSVIFGRNDLVQDAPISRIDLLVCRNTLMYFTAEKQARILERFHFALNDGGALFLGKSEMLVTDAELFSAADVRLRIFRKRPKSTLHDRLSFAIDARGNLADDDGATLRGSVFDAASVAQIVVEPDGSLVAANQQARRLFAVSHADVGRPLQDLELSYRPLELRTVLEQAYGQKRTVHVTGVEWRTSSGVRVYDVRVTPLLDTTHTLGACIAFDDVTEAHRLRQDLERSKQELERAYEELQSTVEELETTNEELQSTNEELETMNEELQSGNEELETINEELRGRGLELDEVNGFLETILGSMELAVVVLDRDQDVRVWNRQAERLWGLRAEEAEGRHVLSLEIGLPLEPLRAPIRDALEGDRSRAELELEAVSRLGRQVLCRVSILPIKWRNADAEGAIMLMQTSEDGAGPG